MKIPDPSKSCGSPRTREAGGFTLVELLIVTGIMIALISMIAPTFNSVAKGSRVTQAGQLIGDKIALARQEAIAKNRDMEVRFINLGTGSGPSWRAVQIWRIEQGNEGVTSSPVTKMLTLPEGVVISPDNTLSPLLTASLITIGEIKVSGGSASVPYAGFRIRANGAVESSVNWTNNFVTLRNENTLKQPLGDYYTIQVNPVTGKGIIYRP